MPESANALQILIDVRSRLDDVVKAQAEFRKMRDEVTGAGQALKTGFGVAIAQRGLDMLTRSVRQFAVEAFHMADSIKDNARNLGLTTEAYQVLGNVMKDAGGDVGLLNMMVSQSNRSLAEARTLSSGAAGAYRALGLDAAELEQLPVERRFERIGMAVARSTDQTKAFSAASRILGARNLPTVLGALRDLAGQYDKTTEAQRRAGRVMTEDTINRLEAAKKTIEKFKQALTIATGEGMSALGAFGNSFRKDFLGTLGDMLAGGPMGMSPMLAARLGRDNPSAPADTAAAQRAADATVLAERLAEAERNLASAILHRQTVESNANIGERQRMFLVYSQMQQELRMRERLVAAAKAMPLDDDRGETQAARDLKIQKLEEENAQLRNQLIRLERGNQIDDETRDSRDRFAQFNDDRQNTTATFGETAMTGAMDWVTSIGTAAQQVAGTLQSSIGAVVDGITQGIYGWITGTMSFGEAMANLGSTLLQMVLHTIVQMGVQMLVNAALGRILTAAAAAASLGAAAAIAAPMAAIWAAPATLATIASYGGAAAQAPVSIGIAKGVVLAQALAGFAGGGYTGDGPRDQIAGVVHGQEGVLNAGAMRRLGRGFLDAANAGRPVSMAGRAPLAFNGRADTATGSSRESVRNTYILMDRAQYARLMQEDSTGWFREMFAAEMRK